MVDGVYIYICTYILEILVFLYILPLISSRKMVSVWFGLCTIKVFIRINIHMCIYVDYMNLAERKTVFFLCFDVVAVA